MRRLMWKRGRFLTGKTRKISEGMRELYLNDGKKRNDHWELDLSDGSIGNVAHVTNDLYGWQPQDRILVMPTGDGHFT